MAVVVLDISMSLDGFVTASHIRRDEPLGDGGEQLYEWAAREDGRTRELLNATVGAVIVGRRTYDASAKWWGADGPSGGVRLPAFIVSRSEPERSPKGSVYTFVTDGIERALEVAMAAARDKAVIVMGGDEIGEQYIRKGLVDLLSIHLVPVLFGSGTRMFEHIGCDHIQLETAEVIEARAAIHLRFRVIDHQTLPAPEREQTTVAGAG